MRRTKQEADKTRSDLLTAAEILFLEKGVAHTSLEQIAKYAGVTRGAIYWHFKNKADLFHAMLNQVRLPTEIIAQRIKQCDPEDPVAGLRNLCVDALASLLVDERKKRIFTILMRRCEVTDELKEAEQQHEAFIKAFIQLCTELFSEQKTAQRLRPGFTPHMAAVAIHVLFIGILSDWLRDAEVIDIQHCQPYFDALLHGIFNDWSAPSIKPCAQSLSKSL